MDWARFDALSDAQVVARPMTDPDNKPLTDADLARMKRHPRAYLRVIAVDPEVEKQARRRGPAGLER
jgi:hypothetical protein